MRSMIPLLLCILAPSLSLASVDTDGDGLADDYEMGYGRYQIVAGSFTWQQAKADAEAKGGHLGTITSDSEWIAIKQALEPIFQDFSRVWLGGTDEHQEGVWKWVTGEVFDYQRWGLSQPIDGTAANYLNWMEPYNDYAWNDEWNDATVTAYLLEFGYPTDPAEADTDGDGVDDKIESNLGSDPNDPNAIPAEYAVTLAAGAHTFEAIEGAYTWHQAKSDAESRGGRLAVFPTGNLYDRIIAKVRQSFAGGLWLGLTDEAQEGVWRWLNGTPLTYSRWYENEPNNNGNEDYAHVSGTGRTDWNDAPSDPPWGRWAYILERRSTSIVAMPWSQGGQPWSVDTSVIHDDVSSAKAQTTDGQSSWREYTVTGPAVVDFWWKVSSQQGVDYFSYSLNGTPREDISGEVNWTSRTLILPAGTHTIRWTYTKDGSDSVGQDAGWLDNLRIRYLAPAGDEDNDGLNNTEETNLGTNPYLCDTDNDGVNDLREVGDGTDPLDPASFDSLNLGLVAYYPFNGNANDENGNQHHASLNGSSIAPPNSSGVGESLHIDGTANSWMQVMDSPKLRPTAATISVWIYNNLADNSGVRFICGKDYGQMEIHFSNPEDPQSGIRFIPNNECEVDTVLGTPAQQWFHLVCVAGEGSGGAKIYINGSEANIVRRGTSDGSEPLALGSSPLFFGRRSDGSWPHLDGRLDNIRIYERVFTATEVASLYVSERYGAHVLEGAATKSPFDPATAANWSAGGTAWAVDTVITHDGVDSVKAQTTNGQSIYREYTVTGPAVVDFWWKVSSEQLYDTFSYSLNSVTQESISGEVDWTYRTLTLPEGTHTIRWTYAKDGSDAVGQDAGWLDDFAVYPATATLQVRDGSTALDGEVTVDFGSADLGSTGFTKTLTFANNGYVPLEVQLSLPQGSPFTFDGGAATYGLFLGRGESVGVPITLVTTAAGNKSVQLVIDLPSYNYPPSIIILSGYVRGPDIGLSQGATTLASGQTFDMGLAPRTVEFTIRNNGNVGDLVISAISSTGNFQITQQPATTIPPQGSTTFKVLAQSITSGLQTGAVSISSNAANLAEFSLPLSSKSFTGIAQGITDGSMATSGTGGAVGWDFATTQLPSGQSGQALKTGTTPNNGGSALEFTAQTAGVVSWSWKVGSQENFDWLLCEVDGQEVAGISTKNGVWQTQVVNVPAGANVRWVYRKDASASVGEDAGYLADVEFRSFAANQPFSQWADTHGIYNPQQRLPKSGMKAKFAWLGGFDPAASLTAGHHVPIMEGGRLKYRFPISKTADGTQQILFSADMSSWTPRRFSQRVVSEDADRMVIEATAPSGTKGFFKVVGSGDTSMVWVEGGTLPQTSELAGAVVGTFQISKTEVTFAEWQEVRDWAVVRGYNDLANVGVGSASNHPVHSVSWEDAVKWCNAKSEKAGLQPVYLMDGSVYRTGGTFWFGSNVSVDPSANGYRLPREAEWEWAASGGGTSQGYVYSGGGDLNSVGWYWDNAGGAVVDLYAGRGTWPVAQKVANELGLYDMSGNLAEWCWDATANYDSWRRLRGGSWEAPQAECGVFARSGRYASHGFYPNERINRAGFRLARNAD